MESSSESWSALLLSLRELLEWTIRKDTELGRLGHITGDITTLQKQQVRVDLLRPRWVAEGRVFSVAAGSHHLGRRSRLSAVCR